MSKFKLWLKNKLLTTLLTVHPTEYHKELWQKYIKCLDTRSHISGPIFFIFGILRLFFIMHGAEYYLQLIVGIQRASFIILLALSIKCRALNRAYLYLEFSAIAVEALILILRA